LAFARKGDGKLALHAPQGSASVNPALIDALQRAKYIYLTTYGRTGRSGTVPTWLWPHDGVVYFTTQRSSLKARRIRDTGRVTVRVGTREGPAFEGRAEWVDDRPDLEAALLRAYRGKYWFLVPLWMGRYIAKGLAAKTSVLIRITPDS
jgi:PPOX class probable F420-dependent enzyme